MWTALFDEDPPSTRGASPALAVHPLQCLLKLANAMQLSSPKQFVQHPTSPNVLRLVAMVEHLLIFTIGS